MPVGQTLVKGFSVRLGVFRIKANLMGNDLNSAC